MKNSRKLEDLQPKVRLMAEAFVAACLLEGIDVIITSTLRDAESQDALYAQGRTTPGRVVTNAKAGHSWHNFGLAFDFVPVKHGKAMWEDYRTFNKCGRIAEECGLEWAGRWIGFPETAHCQFVGGLTLADLRAGKMISNDNNKDKGVA